MFDALKLGTPHGPDGLVLPQVPQRDKDAKRDPSTDMVASIGGSLAAWASSGRYEPKTVALLGAGIWGAALLAGRISYGEPHDYFGRENSPSNASYAALALVAGFGSTWALQGAWRWFWESRK